MYLPMREYLMGLYLATRPPRPGTPRIFRTRKDAAEAYERGDLTVDDPIRVLELEKKG